MTDRDVEFPKVDAANLKKKCFIVQLRHLGCELQSSCFKFTIIKSKKLPGDAKTDLLMAMLRKFLHLTQVSLTRDSANTLQRFDLTHPA